SRDEPTGAGGATARSEERRVATGGCTRAPGTAAASPVSAGGEPGDVPAVAAVETTTERSNADAIARVAAVVNGNDGCADSRNKGGKSDSPPQREKGAAQDGERNNIPPLGRDQYDHSADNGRDVVVAGVRERDDEGTRRKQ
ncbi:unnamed protein product, partial [Ectocarpus sp. 12 AP-2014]